MRLARLAVLSALASIVLIGVGNTVHADPAGPTDYRSEVLDVQPANPKVTFEVIGGDSFLQMTVAPGVEATVIGYRGEPYLWFRADGTVLDNRNSPTTYLNAERYGTDFPDFATPDAEPVWESAGSGGRYAWHDHRAHLMQPIPPPNTNPGDRIVESVVPIVVDGVETKVTVISVWQHEPSTLPLWAAGIIGGAIAVVGGLLWRRRSGWVWLAVAPSVLAFVLGGWQYLSLPAETGPRLAWWALPALAVVASVSATLVSRRAPFAAIAAALVAGVNLGIWGFIKRDGLTAAIVPTSAPDWLDRFGTLLALLGGLVVTALALFEFFGPRRELIATA